MLHVPVLLSEVLEFSQPREGEHLLDCTFGRGGYSSAFLQKDCQVTGIDRDPYAEEEAQKFHKDFPDLFGFKLSPFSRIGEMFPPQSFDIILFDIGVSSPQLDDGKRGFSFNKNGPLDMRMGSEQEGGKTAADLVNSLSEKDLADIFFYYGEEKAAKKYARLICERRISKPFETTLDLADFIKENAASRSRGRSKIHPATLVFQALRIVVNDELNEFAVALEACKTLLRPGGRLVMVTFHSLEDRIAKQFAKENSFVPKISKYGKDDITDHINYFEFLNKKPVTASPEEIKSNPRASSAKLRALKRTMKT
ncbi:MAG: 16S rRNA (cytosine(1402)-N(4))-methyltransferase RsmH [Pseudomonadota bacterium]